VSNFISGEGFEVQTEIVFRGTFRDPDTEELRDPTTVVVTVKPPALAPFVHEWPAGAGGVTRESLGVFSSSIELDLPGVWVLSMQGTGQAGARRSVRIRAKEVI
jgi:hypothetical protein